jgi:hypothetical protein
VTERVLEQAEAGITLHGMLLKRKLEACIQTRQLPRLINQYA